jgi:hypothetical protein
MWEHLSVVGCQHRSCSPWLQRPFKEGRSSTSTVEYDDTLCIMSYGQTWHIADKYPWACKLATCSCVDICCCCLGLADKSNEILVSWQICRIWKNPLAIHNATQPWAVLSPWQNIPAATRLTMERAHRKLNVGQVQKGVDPFWTGSHSQAYMSVYCKLSFQKSLQLPDSTACCSPHGPVG